MTAQDFWKEHREEVAGNGSYPLDPKYIDEFITSKARESEGWAIAYALLQLGECITGAANHIGGVDDFTGIMRIGAWLEELVKVLRKREEA